MRNPKILVLDRAESLMEQVRGVTDDIRPRPDITACTRVGSVGDVLTEDGPFDVLVAGPSLGTRAGLARLEVIHDELPGMSLLLAFNRRPEARLREIVRTGAIDLVSSLAVVNTLIVATHQDQVLPLRQLGRDPLREYPPGRTHQDHVAGFVLDRGKRRGVHESRPV